MKLGTCAAVIAAAIALAMAAIALTMTDAALADGGWYSGGDHTFTGASALNGGVVLADTKVRRLLTCGADGGCDIGDAGTEMGTIWVNTLDDGDGTVTVAAALTATGASTLAAVDASGKVTVGGVFSLVTSAADTLASATTLAPTKGLTYITGNTAITGATITPWTAGTVSIWCNVGGDATGPVVTDGNNLAMAGNLTLGPNDCITWVSDGTNLIEISRSVN